MKHVIIVDDFTKAGRGLLDIARRMKKLNKSVVVDKLSGSPYSKSHDPNNCTLRAIDEALKGKTEKIEDINDLFNDV
ncbi:MAG: hypothetical protein ACOCPW_02380 [Marinilabiliaceae bacterium]